MNKIKYNYIKKVLHNITIDHPMVNVADSNLGQGRPFDPDEMYISIKH